MQGSAAGWMRLYFGQARTLNRQWLRYREQKAQIRQTWRQRLLSAARGARLDARKPFAMRGGLLEVRDLPALADRAVTFSLFAEAARTGTPVSRDAERGIAYILTHPELPAKNAQVTWAALREILGADYPGFALRASQRLGVLK